MTSSEKRAFIGLGVMGFPMAGNLVKDAGDLTVWNRTASKAEKWMETWSKFGGRSAKSARDACTDADYVMMCLGDDDDVRDMTLGAGEILEAMKPGSVLVDHTTCSAALARDLHRKAKKKGVDFVDCPVTGGQIGAENGTLAIMCGGDAEAVERVRPTLATYAKNVTYFGEAGRGQLAKMVNQICIVGIIQSLSEGTVFAEKAGLDVKKLFDCLSNGAAGSWQMDNRAYTMHRREFDFGFAVDWMRKDLAACLDEARKMKLELPIAASIDRYYERLQQKNLGRADTSALIKLLDE